MGSKCVRFIQNGLGVLGFGTGVGFTAYGALLFKETSSTSSATTIAVGALLTTISCCMFSMDLYNNHKVEKLLNGLEKQNTALRESVGNLNTLILQQKAENDRHREIIDEAQKNVESLSERTVELEQSAKQLKQLNKQYQEQLKKNEELTQKMEEEIENLKMLNFDAEHRVEELQNLVLEQKQQIVQLAAQAQNLNNLQRQSVKMIQQLALYGNKCKTFGVDLQDISKDLRETDESLGLTANEMQQQITALTKIQEALEKTDRSLRVHISGKRKKIKSKSSGALLENEEKNS